jgi:hypothetical protein
MFEGAPPGARRIADGHGLAGSGAAVDLLAE